MRRLALFLVVALALGAWYASDAARRRDHAPPSPVISSLPEAVPLFPAPAVSAPAPASADAAPATARLAEPVPPSWFRALLDVHGDQFSAWRAANPVGLAAARPVTVDSTPFMTAETATAPAPVSAAAGAPGAAPGPGAELAAARTRAGTTVTRTKNVPAPAGSAAASPETQVVRSGGPSSGATDSTDTDTPPDPATDPDPEEPRPPGSFVRAERAMTTGAGTVSVMISVQTGGEVTGLILAEEIPAGYQLVGASPAFNKQTGNTYRWLFYGTNFPALVTYQLQGSGGSSINGTWRSNIGTGVITGAEQLP